jgi:bifunctional DNA-binding transcriptional regulator/antitoxin component of YhaV-PrlF toxin-antitoxin module
LEIINLGDAELRTKNQITVPSTVIDFLKLSVGELLIFEQKDNEIIVCKAVIKKT